MVTQAEPEHLAAAASALAASAAAAPPRRDSEPPVLPPTRLAPRNPLDSGRQLLLPRAAALAGGIPSVQSPEVSLAAPNRPQLVAASSARTTLVLAHSVAPTRPPRDS